MKIFLASCLVVPLFVTSSYAAELPTDSINSYLHCDTVVVAKFQIEKIDLENGAKTVVATISSFNPQAAGQMLNGLTSLQKKLKKLKKQSVTELYAIFNPSHMMDFEPYFYVPTKENIDKKKVARLMFSGNINGPTNRVAAKRTNFRGPQSFELCVALGEGVYCGSTKTLESLKRGELTQPTNLKSSFEAVKDRAIQIVFVPSHDLRRVVSETMPALPKIYGSMSGKQLADGIEWAAIGIDIGKTSRVDFVLQSNTNADAENMKNLLSIGLGTITGLTLDKTKDLTEKLSLRVIKNRVTFTFTQKAGERGPFAKAISAPIARAQEAAQRAQCKNNLKQLGIAIHNFSENFSGMPPRSNFDKNGKKLLSWRVFLLPYLGQKDLYNQFHLDESWDSDHNKKLISKMPKVFACPSAVLKKQGKTTYLAIEHEKAVLAEKTNRRFREITDGTSNTILLIEVPKDKSVTWTKPEDFNIDWKNPLKGLATHHKLTLGPALFCDGSVIAFSKKLNNESFRMMITFAGKEVIDRDKIK